jgi:hypothetical protein
MSTEDNQGAPEADAGKNIKAEFDRKIGNVDTRLASIEQTLINQNQQLQAQMEAALAAIATRQQAAQPTGPKKKLADLALENPDEFESELDRRVQEQASRIVNQSTAATNSTNAVLGQLTNDYPELKDASSDLTKKSIELYNSVVPKHLHGTPEGTRMAIREAAADLGVVPVSKRKKPADVDADDYVAPGNTGEARKSSSSKKKDGELTADQIEVARAFFGNKLNVDDPKVRAELTKHANRKNYDKYQG